VSFNVEEWKELAGTNYEASSLGRIRSIERHLIRSNGRPHLVKSKILKPATDESGYHRCGIIINSKLVTIKVHRAICTTFNGTSELEVNHIDGNKKNNAAINLEWVTRSENLKHAFKIGLATPLIGELNPTSKITETQALLVIKMLSDGVGPLKIARELSISKNITKDISRGKTWKHLSRPPSK